MHLDVCEIFYSLQGESTFTGLPCTFVRLSGCNLSCTWCDTRYAMTESEPMSISGILATVKKIGCPVVEVTGGEPLLQDATPELIDALIKTGHTVLLETNGTLDISRVHPDCIRIMDIKCPSSRESGRFLKDNIHRLSQRDEVKFVIGSRKDYEFATAVIREKLAGIQPAKIHLSPVSGQMEPDRLAAWMLEDHLGARLSLQQHKIIWEPDMRGV